MIKDNLDQLYSFTAKLMTLLEDEISTLEESGSSDALKVKKIATDTLNKLVATFVQLNKMSKEAKLYQPAALESEDLEIINNFLQRHDDREK